MFTAQLSASAVLLNAHFYTFFFFKIFFTKFLYSDLYMDLYNH